jgi:putative endonuclease
MFLRTHRSVRHTGIALQLNHRSQLCHPDRSIAIGLTNRNAQWRDLLFASTMKTHCYSVYIIASKSRVLYIGMTNDLSRRVYEHKDDSIDGFSKKYRCHRLVYYESFDDVNKAIDREKQLKRWNRTKKVWLIERRNPTWEDLAAEWFTRHMYQPDQQVPPLAS